MVASTADPRVDFVLEQIETMVATEGGSLELLSSDDNSLELRYEPGVNEDCPDCVPTYEQVTMFLNASLKIHAPHITEVKLS